MQKQLYEVGDRVRLIINQSEEYLRLKTGSLGTVCRVDFRDGIDNYIVCVVWDQYVGGHTCGGLCPNGRGWNVWQYEIEPAEHVCGEIGEPTDADGLLSLLYREV